MRRQLVIVALAVSAMVALAFIVPLGYLVRTTAEDQALDSARADAAALVPVLVSGADRTQVVAAMGATRSGQSGRMTIVSSDGWTIGSSDAEQSGRLAEALRSGSSSIGPVEGGAVEVVAAVATGPGQLSAIRVFVPESMLRHRQWTAWTALVLVALALLALSVLVADRLARSFVRPTENLAQAARQLGRGDLSVRVAPEGPAELVLLSGAFNDLADEVATMLDRERELVAELSHRLRTPLTKLRMRVDQTTDPILADELRRDVDDVTAEVNALIREARRSLRPDAVERSDATAILRERVDYWIVLAEDQDRRLSCAWPSAASWVDLGAAELAAAVDVLIENVFAHTEEGVNMAVGCEANGTNTRIWVGDAGPGLFADDVTRGTSRNGSTGLGLDIARSATERVGGRLEVGRSELGGAEVSLIVPKGRRVEDFVDG